MKVSIRSKLVLLLTVVALLPLLMAIGAILIGGRQLRIEAIGKGIQSLAESEAISLHIALVKDIEKFYLALDQPEVADYLIEHEKDAPDLLEIHRRDAMWEDTPKNASPVREVLDNPLSDLLHLIQMKDPRLAEIMITDKQGGLVAATGKTTDYYQADEAWWQNVENGGKWQIFIPPIQLDQSTGTYGVEICFPILRDEALAGVCKAVLDFSGGMKIRRVPMGNIEVGTRLIREDGLILFGNDVAPMTTYARQWTGPISEGLRSGWRVTDFGEIQGFSHIRLKEEIAGIPVIVPNWTVVAFLPTREAFRPVAELSIIVLVAGVGILVMVFLIGLTLVDYFVIRRVHRLTQATRYIAQGDLGHRIAPRRSTWRKIFPDEFDDLAEDFNKMVDQIQHRDEQLTAANQLKTNFIQVAGHELRTPLSYILGMVRLLKDSRDPDRLQHALQTMGAKAKRLEEIIQTMFKLMPDQQFQEMLDYEDISISEFFEEIFLDCFPFVEQRKQHLIIEGADRMDTIRADREKLSDLLENLIFNAIKFTPDGGVIKVRVSRQLGDQVSFAVQDQGPGIPAVDQPHLFEPFYSGSDVMKHSSGATGYAKRGMGLGLAIVKHFAEMHGGSVSFSTSSNGTVFTATIPIRPFSERTRKQAEDSDNSPPNPQTFIGGQI